jgi:hypothetical protein
MYECASPGYNELQSGPVRRLSPLPRTIDISVWRRDTARTTELRLPAVARNVLLLCSFQTFPKTRSAFYPLGTGVVSPGVKRPGREADHAPSASARSTMVTLQSPLSVRLHGVVLNRLRTGATVSSPFGAGVYGVYASRACHIKSHFLSSFKEETTFGVKYLRTCKSVLRNGD